MAVRCLLCRESASVGVLCSGHAGGLIACRHITAGQIIGQPVAQPLGWLVDQWGRTHPLGTISLLGRDHAQCSLAIMHHSVSARHARIEIDAIRAYIVDVSSLNGTYLNQARVRESRIAAGDRIALGDVAFYFTTRATPFSDLPRGQGGTVPTRASELLLFVRLTRGERAAELRPRVGGGVIRTGGASLDLSRLEYALIHALVEQAIGVSDPDMHFVATQTLLEVLDFRTLDPSGENLRELVRRIRRKLQDIGIDGLIESRRGVGYRLAWSAEPLAVSAPGQPS